MSKTSTSDYYHSSSSCSLNFNSTTFTTSSSTRKTFIDQNLTRNSSFDLNESMPLILKSSDLNPTSSSSPSPETKHDQNWDSVQPIQPIIPPLGILKIQAASQELNRTRLGYIYCFFCLLAWSLSLGELTWICFDQLTFISLAFHSTHNQPTKKNITKLDH